MRRSVRGCRSTRIGSSIRSRSFCSPSILARQPSRHGRAQFVGKEDCCVMFTTITTLFRAQVAEAEEAIFDANAMRLLGQRIREANAAFEAGKRDLAMVLAQESGERRFAAEIGTRIAEEEAAAVRVLDAGNEAEAERLAARAGNGKCGGGGRSRQSAFAEVCGRFRQRHPGGTADAGTDPCAPERAMRLCRGDEPGRARSDAQGARCFGGAARAGDRSQNGA
jgi:hypothetical protein